MQNPFPWQIDCIENILSLKNNNQLHHAILISGAKGSGKKELLKQLGNGILDNKNNYNPDLFIYDEHLNQDKKNISVDIIRKIIELASKTAYLNNNKVVIIPSIEYMNQAASNAFLKILEEPPKNVYFLLSSNNLKTILPTIRSRCYKINAPTPSYDMALDWLIKQNINSDVANILLKLANNMPLLALDYKNNLVYEELYLKLISELSLLDKYSLTTVSENLEKLKFNYDIVLELLMKIIILLLQNKLNIENFDNNLEKLSKKYQNSCSKLNLALEEITKSLKYTYQGLHLNKRSSIEGILYTLC